LLQLPDAEDVRGLVIGRFQNGSGMTRRLLEEILSRQAPLRNRPVLGNVDFGHTYPLATLAIGGQVRLTAGTTNTLTITEH
jgi:muramoyltetrapeptide carboxypeptidase